MLSWTLFNRSVLSFQKTVAGRMARLPSAKVLNATKHDRCQSSELSLLPGVRSHTAGEDAIAGHNVGINASSIDPRVPQGLGWRALGHRLDRTRDGDGCSKPNGDKPEV